MSNLILEDKPLFVLIMLPIVDKWHRKGAFQIVPSEPVSLCDELICSAHSAPLSHCQYCILRTGS